MYIAIIVCPYPAIIYSSPSSVFQWNHGEKRVPSSVCLWPINDLLIFPKHLMNCSNYRKKCKIMGHCSTPLFL